MKRCEWCGTDPLYCVYHDEEWGVPVTDDRTLFEFITLEGAQAGLSWITVLKKRARYKKVFANFDPKKVAQFSQTDVERLLQDPGIIRNRLKVESTISNAQAFLKVQEEFGSFAKCIWAFVDNKPIQNTFKNMSDLPASTPLSDKISKDMKKRGFRFAGSTIMYAYMQATGMVNDHITDCHRHVQCKELGKSFSM